MRPTCRTQFPARRTSSRRRRSGQRTGASAPQSPARNPGDGSLSPDPDHFAAVLRRIDQSVDAVVDFSTGVSLKTPIEDRIAPARRFSPEMNSLKTGSMNFSFHQLARRYNTSRSDWEKYDVENSNNYMLRSTFRDIRTFAETWVSRA